MDLASHIVFSELDLGLRMSLNLSVTIIVT